MVSMVSGCLMYTVLVANATAMIANVDPAAKEYKSKVPMDDKINCSANVVFLKFNIHVLWKAWRSKYNK